MYAIRIPSVQTWAVKKVTRYLSAELNTKVSLERISIEFFSTVKIEGLYVEDLNSDTLLYAGEISTIIDLFAPGDNKIYLSGIDLKNGIFKLQKYPGVKGLNIDFIIHYFSAGKTDTAATKPFDFNPGEVRLSNMEFVYRDNRYHDTAIGIDFDDIRVREIDADLDNIRFDDGGVEVNIENISFTEKSGFRLEYLESNASFVSTGMEFNSLLIKTPNTQLNGNLSFTYENISDFEDFIDKVRINSRFSRSTLSSKDLTYFASELKGLNQEITFDGVIKGTIAQLRGRDLNINFANGSRFAGDISIAGLPDFNESFFDIVVDEFITDKRDIESIPAYPFTQNKNIVLPENFSTLGKVIFSGKFTGFLNDFVAYGNMSTGLGFISSDINLKIDHELNKSSYSGHLSVNNFDVGKLTGSEKFLGRTSFKADVEGSGLTLETVNARMDGLITSLEINQYEYNNIDVNGRFARKKFEGELSVSESNLNLDFTGSIDLSKSVAEYDFTATIEDAKLARLNLIKRDTSSVLNTSATIKLKGNTIDDLSGTIKLGTSSYTEKNENIRLDSLVLYSNTENAFSTARLRSNLIDFDLSGNYTHSKIISELEKLIKAYLPMVESGRASVIENVNINYSLTIKKLDDIFKIFFPVTDISPGTIISGKADNLNSEFSINISSDSIRYDEIMFRGIDIHSFTEGNKLIFNNRVQKIDISDTLHVFNTVIEGSTDKFRSGFSISASARDTSVTHVTVSAEANYLPSGRTLVRILPSDIEINDQVWKVDELNTILIDSSVIDINNFTVTSGNERLSINGVISSNLEDKVSLQLRNFNTEVLNPLLAIYNFNMGGVATGTGDFSGLLAHPAINSDMHITNLAIYGDTLGDASIDFDYKTESNIITAKALVDKGGTKNIELSGSYYIRPVMDSLDFRCTLQKTNLTAFAGYAKGLVSDVRGKASGELRLRGPVDKLTLTGKARLQQTSFVVDYLNTRYNFSDEVEFNEKSIRFRNITVNDENGNQARVDGDVYHKNLRDFSLNIDIRATNFQALNTTAMHNELFYGEAYGTGNVKISGPLDLITIRMGMKTEKNTRIFIPLSNPEEISKSSYINFVSHDKPKNSKEPEEVKFTGINMDFELDVTPDAEVQLIFDSKIGDIIKGRGNGNIKIEIDAQGDFKMFGSYQVVSGDYLFTLQNLINKKFIITPGGIITWSGSPYEAEINLEGVYRIKASLYDLIQDTTLTKRIPVEVHLKLEENLFNPTIRFDIVIPDIDPTAEALVKRYISTEQEKSTQTMSLLVINRFSKAEGVEYQGSSSTGVGANAAELLSHQLSNWASQISDVVNVGVNYRAADAFSKEEIEVAVSTQILNDRVTIDGNVGVSDNNQNTSNLIGDFTAELKASDDGRLRFKFFNKTITNSILNNYTSPYTQGLGILYRQEFNTTGELFRKFISRFKKQDDPVKEDS